VYSPRPISGAAVYGQSDAQPLWPLFAAPAYTQITATAHADKRGFEVPAGSPVISRITQVRITRPLPQAVPTSPSNLPSRPNG